MYFEGGVAPPIKRKNGPSCNGKLHMKCIDCDIRVSVVPPGALVSITCRYDGNDLSGTIEKHVLHIYTPWHTSVPSFIEIGQKLRKKFATQNFPSFWLIICELCYHGNTLFVTVKKCVMLTYILRQTLNMNSMRIGRTLMKQFACAMKHFAKYFTNNMPLPWQHTFCHCRNMSCKLTSSDEHLCQIS